MFNGLWDFEGGCLQVAVKVLKPDMGQNEQDKFLQEAATMGQFYHENVVQLHGVTSVGKPVSDLGYVSTLSVTTLAKRKKC